MMCLAQGHNTGPRRSCDQESEALPTELQKHCYYELAIKNYSYDKRINAGTKYTAAQGVGVGVRA